MKINKLKGFIIKNQIINSVLSNQSYISNNELELADNNLDSFYNITNISKIYNDNLSDYRLSSIIRRNLNYQLENNYDKLEEDYYLYVIRDKFNDKTQVGLLANLSVDYIKNNRNLVVETESCIESTLHNKTTELSSTRRSISPIYMIRDSRNLSNYMYDLYKIGECELISSVSRGMYEHSIYRRCKSHEVDIYDLYLSNIIKGIDKLYIADGHHRFNASLNANLRNIMVAIFDSDSCKVGSYDRVNYSDINEDGIVGLIEGDYREIERLPLELENPVIAINTCKGTRYFELSKGFSRHSDMYDYVDNVTLNRLRLVLDSDFIYEPCNSSDTDRFSIKIMMPNLSVTEVLDSRKLPPKSTNFSPKPLDGFFVGD